MIVIRRMVDRRRAYTAIFLKGEPPKIFPTSDAEHARILQVYKQDKLHEGILNDFSEDAFLPLPVKAASEEAKAGTEVSVAARVKAKAAAGKKPKGPVRKEGQKKVAKALVTKDTDRNGRGHGVRPGTLSAKKAKGARLWLVVVPEEAKRKGE